MVYVVTWRAISILLDKARDGSNNNEKLVGEFLYLVQFS